MKLLFKSSFLFFIVIAASANNKVGNGGKGVFCKEKPGRLLEFYETENNFSSDEADPFAIAEKQLKKLKIIAPKIGSPYLKRLKELSSQIEYKPQVILTEIPDSYHLFRPLPENCEIIQVAIRRTHPLPTEKHFLFRKDLWEKMARVDQAGLLTHEIVYEHFSKLGDTNSIKARKVNSFLFSSELDKNKFWILIKELEVPLYP